MEFNVGQELFAGVNTSAVIFHVDSFQVSAVNWDGKTLIYDRHSLQSKVDKGTVIIKEGISEPHMAFVHAKARDYADLLATVG